VGVGVEVGRSVEVGLGVAVGVGSKVGMGVAEGFGVGVDEAGGTTGVACSLGDSRSHPSVARSSTSRAQIASC
jgi:hypothetical protein